jgi:sec-independent protein translocase protein TatB
MFDIAFSELMVIGIVAVIVIGPEKLPKVARTVGHLMGKAQRYIDGVKSDISNELRLEDLHRLQKDIQQDLHQVGTAKYHVGQVIKHKMEQEGAIKYQVGQIINHAIPQQPILPVQGMETTKPSPFKPHEAT